VELAKPCTGLIQQAFERKLLLNVTADSVIRLLPPLIINQSEADLIVGTVCDLIKQI
jgi:acetylornithine aminotransferase